MPTIQYPNNPNTDTAFVEQDDGTKNRALMTAPQDTSTLELPSNPNSTKGYVTVDGKKQRVILTADIGGGYKVPTSVPDLMDTDWVLDSGTGKYNQTINVPGVTATNTVFVSPLPVTADDWASSNILCIAQGAGTLTFTCGDTVPSTSGGWIGVNVVIFG